MTDAQELTLPPLTLTLNPSESGKLSSGARVFVREFRFQGNTVFSSDELSTITASYLNRELTSEQLEEVRRIITAFYVEFGYMNSGAILPDQDVKNGVVTFQIIEGALSDIKLRGKNRWLRDSYVTDRLWRSASPPLRIAKLKEGLLLLRQDPNVKQINAELRPGTKPGDSYLDVYLQEEQPFRLGLQVDNHRPPSVGAEEIVLFGADYDLTGNGDLLEFSYGIAHNGRDGFEFSGSQDESGSYTLPIHSSGTTIKVFGSRNDTSIVEEPFAILGITNNLTRYGVTLRQPVYQTVNRELALGVTFERDHNEAFFLGQPATGDVVPGSVNGKIDASVLRFTQEWLDRSQSQVLALRSTFNVGIDAFGITDHGTDRGAKFFSWLGQCQYVRRLFNTPNLIVLRTDGQWTGEPLSALEQFSVGGANSVRGYRENQLVRDRGFVSSIEGRVPILSKAGGAILQLAPFFDCGGAWTLGSKTPSPETIYSSGIGILVNPNKHLAAQLYWGYRFTHVPNPHNNVQDLGIQFKVTYQAF